MTGAELFGRCPEREGVRYIVGVPGEKASGVVRPAEGVVGDDRGFEVVGGVVQGRRSP